jgi:subtilisin family serine protease
VDPSVLPPGSQPKGSHLKTSQIAVAMFCTVLMIAASVPQASAHGNFNHSESSYGDRGIGVGAWRIGDRPRRSSRARAPVGQPPSGQGYYPVRWRHPPPRWDGMQPIHHHPVGYPVYGSPEGPAGDAGPQPNSSPKTPGSIAKAIQRATTGVPAQNEQRFVPDEVLFTSSGSEPTAEAIARRHRLTLVTAQPISLIGSTLNRYRISDRRTVRGVIRELEAEPQVTWVQPNYIFTLEGVNTNAQGLSAAQYAIVKMHVPEAHRVTEGDKTLVAIIDSAVDEKHADLAGAIVNRVDLVGGAADADTHGTAMAGIIAAHGALVGVAPHASILAIRAFSDAPAKPGAEGTTAHIIEGLDWAYAHKARIVNMSFAGPYDPMLAQALGAAHRKGIILVAAAGNEGPKAAPAYPAADPNVIAVTATDREDNLFSGANRGAYICVAAPGTDIIVAAPANSYQFSSGTSLGAAHITGLVALLLTEKPDLGAEATRQILIETAHDLGPPGRDDEFGAGLGDAASAVAFVKNLRDQRLAGQSGTLKALQGIQDATQAR